MPVSVRNGLAPNPRLNCSDVSRTMCRLPGAESGPRQHNAESAVGVPDQEQLNGSDSANNLDPNALVGLDSLLQELQNSNASNNIVSTSSPDDFDFSRSPTQVGENVVQVAATALNQLSQPEAPDGQYPFAGLIFPVCLFSSHRRHITVPLMIRLASTVPQFWDPAAAIATPTRLSQSEDHGVPAVLLLR